MIICMNKRLRDMMNNTYIHAVVTAVLAGCLFLVFVIVCHITPFGDNTWLVYDMKRQYADFYSYYKTILSGENNIIYSPAIALGSAAVGFFTYYLSSPFLIILRFFDETKIPMAITLMIGLKLALSAGSCDLFLDRYVTEKDHLKNDGHHPKTLIFALSYAYCAYMISNSVNPMWLDVFALMPVVILMLDRLIEKKAKTGYIITLALMLWCNYYMAFMVCIFIIMWMTYRLISDPKGLSGKLIRVALCSFWAGCLDAVLILPTALELIGSPKDIFVLGLETTKGNLTLNGILVKMWFLAYEPIEAIFGTPLIYAGVFIIFLVLLYVMNSNIKIAEKICMILMLAVFILSFAFDKINLIWHAGMEPSGYPYREAYLYVFICIICACRCFNRLDGVDIKRVFLASAATIALFVFSLTSRHYCINTRFIVMNSLLIGSVAIMLLLYVILTTKGRFHRTDITQNVAKAILVILICVQVLELTVNSVYIYKIQTSINMLGQSEYENIIGATKKAVEIAKEDKSFYHMENMSAREQNDDMMYNYNGVTHYSSAGLLYTRYFLQKLGYNDDGLYTDFGNDNTFTADSLLAIKYLVGADGYRDGYEKISDLGGGVYKNPYALSAACLVDRMPLDDDLRAFRLQEKIYNDINGRENHIFVNDIFYSQIFAKDDLPYMCHMCKAECDGYVYLYIDDIEDYSQNLSVYEEDRLISGYGNSGSYKILNLGYHKKGERFDIYVRSDSKEAKFGTAYIVSEDIDALKHSYEEAKARDCEVIRHSSSRFEIKVPQNIDRTASSGVMTTFPYEKGWKVKVNGEKIEPECIYEAFMFIPLKESDKDVSIQMSYHPEGMAEGAIITLIAVIGIVLLNIIDRRKM